MPTLPERILEVLEISPGLSDREITDTLFGHSASQQPVNQACRKLESRGLLSRRVRPDGRIGNFSAKQPRSVAPLAAQPEPSAPGDSTEQRQVEELLINLIATRLGIALKKRRIDLPGGGWFEVDGASDSPPIICEAWAHIGLAKSAQKNKLVADAFKLVFAGQLLPAETKKILVVADADAVHHLQGRSWMAQALRANRVEIAVVELPEDVRAQLREAQRRQFR